MAKAKRQPAHMAAPQMRWERDDRSGIWTLCDAHGAQLGIVFRDANGNGHWYRQRDSAAAVHCDKGVNLTKYRLAQACGLTTGGPPE